MPPSRLHRMLGASWLAVALALASCFVRVSGLWTGAVLCDGASWVRLRAPAPRGGVAHRRGNQVMSAAFRNEAFSAVWTEILNGRVIKSPDNPRLWSLPGGIEWICGIGTLYNRPCYDDMIATALSSKMVTIIGTTGIGKTLFLQVFLAFLADRARAEGQPPPSIHYMWQALSRGPTTTLSFLADGSVIHVSELQRRNQILPDYVLSDNLHFSAPQANVLTVVASDRDFEVYSKEPYDSDHRISHLVMPVFSREELLSVRRAEVMSAEELEFRHDVFGGSARNCLCLSNEASDFPYVSIVDDTMTMFFPDVKNRDYSAWRAAANEVMRDLVTEAPRVAISSTMMHLPARPNSQKTWASTYMEWLAAAIIEHHTTNLYDEIQKIVTISGDGFLFRGDGAPKVAIEHAAQDADQVAVFVSVCLVFFKSDEQPTNFRSCSLLHLERHSFQDRRRHRQPARRSLWSAHVVHISDSRRRRHPARHAHTVCIFSR